MRLWFGVMGSWVMGGMGHGGWVRGWVGERDSNDS
jgi:hypothetical protein